MAWAIENLIYAQGEIEACMVYNRWVRHDYTSENGSFKFFKYFLHNVSRSWFGRVLREVFPKIVSHARLHETASQRLYTKQHYSGIVFKGEVPPPRPPSRLTRWLEAQANSFANRAVKLIDQ